MTRHRLIATFVLTMVCFAGCQTLRVGEGDQAPIIAMWPGFATVDKQGRKIPATAEQIARALQDVGINATVDDGGLHIAPADETRAWEALLTDKRLTDSSIVLFVPVNAGSGTKTARGIVFEMPTTVPSD